MSLPLPLRLGLYYAALYVSSGVGSPYLPVWFREHGLGGAAIGALLAAPQLARILTGPALAVWAEGFRDRRTAMLLLALAAAAAIAALGVLHGFWPWLIAWFLGNSAWAALTPLVDTLAIRRALSEGFNYGWPRGMGSLAFVVGNVAMGAILTRTAAWPVVAWMVGAAVLSAAGALWLLPAEPAPASAPRLRARERWRGVGGLLTDPTFMLALISPGLILAAHAFYYSFSTLAWRAQGLSPGIIGLLWGFAVVVEVAFLWFGEPFRRRMGPERLVLIAAAASVVRWTAFALSPPVWLLFPLQALHAFTFMAAFVGSLELVQRLAPEPAVAAGQSLNNAVASGLLIGLATLGSGALFDHAGVKGYLAMSAMCAAGGLGILALPKVADLSRAGSGPEPKASARTPLQPP